MMINKMLVALVVFTGLMATPVAAQNASSQSEMPAIQEAPAEAGQSGLLSGEKPFTLMVDENVGELIYQFDEVTKELESINAKRGVIFASEDMTLNTDEMEYQTLNSSLVATGKRVVVRMGEMIVTCQLFKYNPETQEGQFEGQPIVYQRNKDGNVTETAGRIISIVNVNGKFQMRVGSGGGISTYVRSTGVAPETGTLEKKNLAPGQKGASIILNNTSSPSGGSSSGVLPSPAVDVNLTPGTANTEGKAPSQAAPSAGRIDPENPADVQKFTNQKAE